MGEAIELLKRARRLQAEESKDLGFMEGYFYDTLIVEIDEFLWKVKGISVKEEDPYYEMALLKSLKLRGYPKQVGDRIVYQI